MNDELLRPSEFELEMREISEGKRPLQETPARRHHYVPSFSLAQFASPAGERKGRLYQLKVASGQPQRTTPNDAAYEIDLYSHRREDDRRSNLIESFLSILEKHASRAFARLRDRPEALTPQDRHTIAYFLVFQQSRTPGGLQYAQQLQQALVEFEAAIDLSTPGSFKERFGRSSKADADEREEERLRLRMKEQLEVGSVTYEQPRPQAMRVMLQTATEMAATVYGLDWTVLSAQGAEFITSDRPVSMFDPTPEHPWTMNGWESSPNALSFFPVSPSLGLFLRPGDCELSTGVCQPDHVRRLNLFTYGWAERVIFGSSQQGLAHVRRQAKLFPNEVKRPRPPRQVVLIDGEADAQLQAERKRRGFPLGFRVRTHDGSERLMDYAVVDLDGPPGQVARAAASVAERVNKRSKSH